MPRVDLLYPVAGTVLAVNEISVPAREASEFSAAVAASSYVECSVLVEGTCAVGDVLLPGTHAAVVGVVMGPTADARPTAEGEIVAWLVKPYPAWRRGSRADKPYHISALRFVADDPASLKRHEQRHSAVA